MASSADFNERTLKLHEELVAGSFIATAQLSELLLPKIFEALKKKFPNISDEHLIQTASNDAVLYYLKSPNNFDPSRASLLTFVLLRAKSNVLNFLKTRKNKSEILVELPEEETVYSNESVETIEELLILNEHNEIVFLQLRELLPDSLDRSVLELMINGERETLQFAKIIGVSDKSPEEQFKIVKRHKDRIKKVIQRRYVRQ